MQPRISLVAVLSLACSLPATSATDGPTPQPAQLVPLSSVRLLDGPFVDAVTVNRAYLLALDLGDDLVIGDCLS